MQYHHFFPENKISVLKSFSDKTHMYQFAHTHRDKLDGFVLDSGTWAVQQKAQKKKNINLRSYTGYAKRYAGNFDFVFNFDDNFTEKGFENNHFNQQDLEAEGLKPVPVIHNIYNDEIEYYLDMGYRRIALGSSQITSQKKMDIAMKKFENSSVSVHLFGNTKFEFLANYPLSSADSSTASLTGAYGDILFWNPYRLMDNKTDRIYLGERAKKGKNKRGISYSEYAYKRVFDEFLHQNFKMEYYDLIGPDAELNKALVNIQYYEQFEAAVNELHHKQGFGTVN